MYTLHRMTISVRRTSLVLLSAAAAALASTTLAVGSADAATSTITSSIIPGMQYPLSINNSGQILGFTYHGDHTNPLCVFGISGVCQALENAQVINGTTVTTLTRTGAKGLNAISQNDAGTVLGESLQVDGNHADVFIGAGASKTAVQLDSNPLAQGDAINASGQVLATYTVSGVVHAVIASGATASKAPTLTQIGVIGSTSGGTTVSTATAINASGAAVGYGTNTGNGAAAAKPWRFQNGVLTWLPLPAPWTSGQAMQINSSGWALGYVTRPATAADKTGFTDVQHVALWEGSTFIDLGSFGGAYVGLGTSQRANSSINDAGQVVGFSYLAGDNADAGFVWQNGVMTKLSGPTGYDFFPAAINKAGDIAGAISQTGNPTTTYPGFLHKGVLTNLQNATGTVGTAIDINDTGSVLGGFNATGVVVWHVPTS